VDVPRFFLKSVFRPFSLHFLPSPNSCSLLPMIECAIILFFSFIKFSAMPSCFTSSGSAPGGMRAAFPPFPSRPRSVAVYLVVFSPPIFHLQRSAYLVAFQLFFLLFTALLPDGPVFWPAAIRAGREVPYLPERSAQGLSLMYGSSQFFRWTSSLPRIEGGFALGPSGTTFSVSIWRSQAVTFLLLAYRSYCPLFQLLFRLSPAWIVFSKPVSYGVPLFSLVTSIRRND